MDNIFVLYIVGLVLLFLISVLSQLRVSNIVETFYNTTPGLPTIYSATLDEFKEYLMSSLARIVNGKNVKVMKKHLRPQFGKFDNEFTADRLKFYLRSLINTVSSLEKSINKDNINKLKYYLRQMIMDNGNEKYIVDNVLNGFKQGLNSIDEPSFKVFKRNLKNVIAIVSNMKRESEYPKKVVNTSKLPNKINERQNRMFLKHNQMHKQQNKLILKHNQMHKQHNQMHSNQDRMQVENSKIYTKEPEPVDYLSSIKSKQPTSSNTISSNIAFMMM